MKWIASLLLLVLIAVAIFASAPVAMAGKPGGTPPPQPTAQPDPAVVSK